MIQSLPGPWGTPPRQDPPVEPRKAPRDSGFAGLLGAGDRPVAPEGAEAPVVGAPGSPLGPLVADAPDPEVVGVENSTAERFNEHGFFGEAVAAPDADALSMPLQDGSVGRGGIVAGEALVGTPVAPGSSPPVLSIRNTPAELAEKLPQSIRSGHADGAVRVASQMAGASRAPAPSVTGENGDTPDGVRETASPGRRLLAAAANRAAQAATRVAISETDVGLRVAALAGTLSNDERTRLRDEIAALLSRHGLVPDQIHIAARRTPRASAQENIR